MSEAVYHLPQRIDESAHRNAIGNYSTDGQAPSYQ